MATQTENGKAFEWAVAKAVESISGFNIIDNDAAITAQKKFDSISTVKKNQFILAATASVNHIWEKENQRIGTSGTITIASDAEGQSGDVIDVLITGHVSIGISCKTNHDALKHSRLSSNLDFVKRWGLSSVGCSKEYWNAVTPIFDKLSTIRKESNKTALWCNEPEVPTRFYWPILDAFAKEIIKLQTEADEEFYFCTQLFLYLVGKQDFYKIMSMDGKVEIQAFNFNGTLAVGKMKVPTKIIGIDNKNGGQYSKTIRFTNGYTINFRIHNASSRVEPSLKFDIRMLGVDPHGYRHSIEIPKSSQKRQATK